MKKPTIEVRAMPRGGWLVVVVARGAAVWSAKARTVGQVRLALGRAARRRLREERAAA